MRAELMGWAVTFMILALVAGVLGYVGLADTAGTVAWTLFGVSMVLAIVMFLAAVRPGRRG